MGQTLKEKYNNLPAAVKASVLFVFCGILKDAIDFIVTPIFSRILEQEEYGLFNVYNSWYQIFHIAVSLYIFSDGFVVGLSRFGNKKEEFTSSQQGLILVLALPWILLYALNFRNWNTMLQMNTIMVVLMISQIVFTTPMNLWVQKKRYTYDYRPYVPVMIIYALMQPLLALVLIFINNLNQGSFNNGVLRIYAGVGVQIAFGFVLMIMQFIRTPKFADKEYWGFSLSTNSVLVPYYFSQILLNHSDKLMIDRFVGKAQTAVYSIAHSAAFTLLVVTGSLNSTFTPWLHNKLKTKDTSEVKKLTSSLIILVAVCSLIIFLMTPELMMILGDEKYAEGKWIVPPLTFGVFIIFIYTLLADVELYFSGNKYVTFASILGAAVNIILNYLLIPKIGYLVAGYTTIIGYLVMCACHLIFLRIICRKQDIKAGSLFDIRIILLVTVVLAALLIGVMCLYQLILIRYIILFGLAAALFIKRKMIIDLISGIKKKS
jgi:O-antigen/teichoic acid export membrane protein